MAFYKGVAVTGFGFGLVNATTGAAVTTGTTTGLYTLDGGTQGSISGTCTHEGGGQWSVNLTAGEMNGDVVLLTFSNSIAIPVTFTIKTIAQGSITSSTPGSLAAVNEMLEAIGEPPVTALDTGGTSEAGEAETILARVNSRIQSLGWWCNTIKDVTYTPSAGIISLGASVLKVELGDTSGNLSVCIRNAQLYDLENATNNWGTTTVNLDVTSLVAFDQLPPMLAAYITRSACVRFQRYKKRGTVDDAMLGQEVIMARLAAYREDNDLARHNINTTPESRRVKGDRNGRRAGYMPA